MCTPVFHCILHIDHSNIHLLQDDTNESLPSCVFRNYYTLVSASVEGMSFDTCMIKLTGTFFALMENNFFFSF